MNSFTVCPMQISLYAVFHAVAARASRHNRIKSIFGKVMRRYVIKSFSIGMLVLACNGAILTAPALAGEPVKVVYHLSEGIDQAARALGNIRNHLRAEPDTRIVIVALGDGIRFLLEEAKERNGKPFDAAVAALARQGVEFKICNNTLTAHNVPATKVLPQAALVPAGVAEIARLQAREGFVYLRP
jgi:intracellular sulfur oxidation DsrE/DsrF family protein